MRLVRFVLVGCCVLAFGCGDDSSGSSLDSGVRAPTAGRGGHADAGTSNTAGSGDVTLPTCPKELPDAGGDECRVCLAQHCCDFGSAGECIGDEACSGTYLSCMRRCFSDAVASDAGTESAGVIIANCYDTECGLDRGTNLPYWQLAFGFHSASANLVACAVGSHTGDDADGGGQDLSPVLPGAACATKCFPGWLEP